MIDLEAVGWTTEIECCQIERLWRNTSRVAANISKRAGMVEALADYWSDLSANQSQPNG